MRHSDFWRLMDEEFGAGYSRSLAREQVVTTLGGRTVEEALAAHVSPREVWFALCEQMDVPPQRRWGADPKKRRG